MINYKFQRKGLYGADGLHELKGRPTYGGEVCWVTGLHGAVGLHGLHRVSVSFMVYLLFFIISLACPSPVQAQIKIGGNVYGGGNQANVNGSTKVTVRAGDIGAVEERTDQTTPVANPKGKVFGGARMADVGGNTFVHIDGENATDYIVVNYVYGGNDIAGTIGTAAVVNEAVPSELTEIKKTAADNDNPRKNAVDNTFNSYVRVSAKVSSPAVYYTQTEIDAATESSPAYGKTVNDVKTPAVPDPTAKKIYIGQLFAGGNGDYDFVQPASPGEPFRIYNKNHTSTDPFIAENTTGFTLPEQNKAYLEVVGGSIVYAYGGGNNATVKEKTIIHVDNPSKVVNHILVNASWLEGDATTYTTYETNLANGSNELPTGYADLLCTARFKEMGINTGFSKPSSDEFQIGRFFGGNNMAEMAIQPTWNLLGGKIRNVYSGGNRGRMTSPTGLLVEIQTFSDIIIDYLYGGCRMADVCPEVDGVYTPCTNLTGYYFPNELSARVLVRGGDVHNVYGGNDVTGRVYGGNAIGIYTHISGDVYGGGNGSYPYTDNSDLKDDDVYGDLYYTIPAGKTSLEALNAFRPNAEQVSIRLKGPDAEHPVTIGGSIYCGGNSATLTAEKKDPLVELKIGSHVIADRVFLGNNGETMVDEDYLKLYANQTVADFSTLDLTDGDTFAGYMEGAAMSLRPRVVFDSTSEGDPDDYDDYTSKIGSFYCGGNVGSVIISGKYTLEFDRGLVIFEKLVGGCNNANVAAGTYNAAYEGGILGSSDEQASYTDNDGNILDRLDLNLNNVVIWPSRWTDTFVPITADDLTADSKLKAGEEYYTTTLRAGRFIADGTEVYNPATATDKYYKRTAIGDKLEWNTTKWSVDEDDFVAIGTDEGADQDRRLYGGNVYGGCYNSGHVNGNVTININQDLHQRNVLFAETTSDDVITGARRTGVILQDQADDVQAVALTLFGAGFGEDTEIWGGTTVNLNNGYVFQVFGGGELGVVGKKNGSGVYEYNPQYSTTVNLKGINAGYSEEEDGLPLAEAEYLYGAGNEGDVCGDSYVNLGNGRIFDAFGGASNANILGSTAVIIGHDGGFPWMRDNIYGGNDFGGTIFGKKNHTTDIGERVPFDLALLESSTYVKYVQGRVDSIFGGCYGSYNYASPVFKYYTYSTGETGIPTGSHAGDPREDSGFSFPHMKSNSFVHFVPADNSSNYVGIIYGGSEGFPGHTDLNNSMHEETYVLIDDTETRNADRFANLDVFGGGAYAGLGTTTDLGCGRSAVDLYAGSLHNIYGGSNKEGLIGYARVNVPAVSTIQVQSIFGGGQGYDPALFATKKELAERYCDHYVTCVDYKSPTAIVNDAIYGGNQNSRIACDTYINIEAPVLQSNGYQATIYGAGYGTETVSGRTNVFMNSGSNAYKVFGGGNNGNAFNFASLREWLSEQYTLANPSASDEDIAKMVTAYGTILTGFGSYIAAHALDLPTNIGTYPNASTGLYDGTYTNDILTNPDYHQTNVHIMQGGNVSGYAYGGGYGEHAVVSGSTYIELLAGTVNKDIYAGGEGGPVYDEFGLKNFVATTNAYIEGGTVRNVYGGGYLGHVGKHSGAVVDAAGGISESNAEDIPGVANVTIGIPQDELPTNPIAIDAEGYDPDFSFHNGIPAILRNAYGGGEGGSVYGTSNITLNNGYIGYRYQGFVAVPNGTKLTKDATYYTSDIGDGKFTAVGTEVSNGSNYFELTYAEELDDQTPNAIELAGCLFGGGYVINSYVDATNVKMYGGTVRGSVYGGGEIGPIGRGTIRYTTTAPYTTYGVVNGNARIYKAGKTHVQLFDGHVKRNVYGGGRGHDSWGGDGTKFMREHMTDEEFDKLDFKCKGYIFGQTEVDIYGGEVGTDDGVLLGYGNVFGGCDLGSVYSAYENESGLLSVGLKSGKRYNQGIESGQAGYNDEGYYYKYENGSFVNVGSEKVLTEDCKVVVEPWCKATGAVSIDNFYPKNSIVPDAEIAYINENNLSVKTSIDATGKVTATDGIRYSHSYVANDFVPTAALNTLGNKSASATEWTRLSKTDVNKVGVIIHNAVFAGGNVTSGSTDVYANTPTVFGNATASIHDVYNRDLISIGRGRVGGLYGDGNLTLVDGYRELNITNYGTDFYHITPEITLAQYNALPIREAAYYEIRYKCLVQCTDKDGKTYSVNSTITADELQTVFDGVTVGGQPMIQTDGKPNPTYWQENGVCSRYAGRPMNTIQRADFCGVFGSRMVMQGAQDRVPETIDYTNYTINRVREVSLNKKVSVRSGDATDSKNAEHGNYFGIYSIVNFLGALTSDYDFHDYVRYTDNEDVTTYQCDALGADNQPKAYGTASFADWKRMFPFDRRRNNGNSHNKVALASGVYLELTTEESTGTDLYDKVWGTITGVVELDLINVQTGIGGGYVYARNEHGVRSGTGKTQTILTALNTGAITNKKFQYTTAEDSKLEWETSGNFVHSTQTIIDDCYNIGGKYGSGYNKPDGVPAHYWFIKGSVYIYDQYISAYTGSPNAYSEIVSIPLTITSASHGKMTLLNVMPNRYAYYSAYTSDTKNVLGEDDKIELREKEYGRNDAINYWDYSQLTSSEKNLFVSETYVVTADCTYGTGSSAKTYTAGTVLLPGNPDGSEEGTYYYLKKYAPQKDLDEEDSDESTTPYVHHVGKDMDVEFDYVFRPSNNVSHDTGYILTYTIDNPSQWNRWYTPKDSATPLTSKKDSNTYSDGIKSGDITPSDYEDGPTYTPTATGMFGQNDYTVGSIISDDEYTTYLAAYAKLTTEEKAALGAQATFYPAYIVTDEVLETRNEVGTEQRFHKGATLSAEDYTTTTWSNLYNPEDVAGSSVAPAYVVTNTIQLSPTEYIYRGSYMTLAERTAYYNRFNGVGATDSEKAIAAEILKLVVPAHYCTEAGKYGGNYYQTGHNYRGLAAFSSMSETDRANFTFNYDALDLLIDPTYSRAEGVKYQYDSSNADLAGAEANRAHYSLQTPIDYSATYKGDTPITYEADNGASVSTSTRAELTRTEYERLPNEQYHYAPISVSSTSDTYYVVTKTIVLGDTPYAAGQVISKDTYDGLSGDIDNENPDDDGEKANVARLTFPSTGTYYYCREAYTIPNNDNGHAVSSADGVTGATGGEYAKNTEVPAGVVISEGTYETLTNMQVNFAIHGLAPTETSTLYVTRNSDIFDLSAEKIITVIYQYDYVESDMSGTHITPVSERHILNIHLNFKSGIPTVEDIQAPEIVLPGTSISIPEPYVTPGAYEITGSGWELFDDEGDAEAHVNGFEYIPSFDPLYLYQNNSYLAYYTKTYLGKTYSNYVPVSVANYHDLKKVIEAKDHHYYIDHKKVIEVDKVAPKIYINDYSGSNQNGLDLFKSLYDLSVLQLSDSDVDEDTGLITKEGSAFVGHKPLDERVKDGSNLEFFIRTDISHADDPAVANEWTPIASGTNECFEGTLHGDGHTISGLDNSLFGHLCGDVYNLGVTGSFTSAGVADDGGGYVESCWVKTTGTTPLATPPYPVFGAPSDVTGIQVVNSYFWSGNNELYNTTTGSDGLFEYANHSKGSARAMTSEEFYNGTVAYNLNNFYLYKRYSDKKVTPSDSKVNYKYYTIGEDNNLVLQAQKYYDSNSSLCSSGIIDNKGPIKYVEDRFADGDFRYAAGTIPSEADERMYTDPDDATKQYFYPIWPDDYIFFGQKLTYGYSPSDAHQEVPTAVVRNNGRLSLNDDANRVYRSPAYYGSMDMGVAHFNPKAYLAQKSSDGSHKAYPGMTAIDFAGHNEPAYAMAYSSEPWFYPPLLDDDGLKSIVNQDETQNLLVYAPAETSTDGYANKKTFDVLTGYFVDPAYTDYYDNNDGYRRVNVSVASIYGHLIQSDLTATNDHLLVDLQDFNCPIEYNFDDDHLMWYQRTPEDHQFVDHTKGWQGISLPFTAELVTTQTKGEITHFFSGSESSKNGTGTKIGHEYWLREFNNIAEETTGGVTPTTLARATFLYPSAATGFEEKDVTNTFLWDYYYKNDHAHNQLDRNADTYLQYQKYYNKSRSYPNYPLLTAATPYIIGFPGDTYYEFDLSGSFEALNTAAALTGLDKQTITFASNNGATIAVSDTETPRDVLHTLEGATKDYSFTFHSNYLTKSLTLEDYALNTAGDKFDKVTSLDDGVKALPFRPYFTANATAKSGGGGDVKRELPGYIVFSGTFSDEDTPESALDGTLEIFAQGRNIVTRSHMKEATTIRIVNAAGITLSNFVLPAGQTIETPVHVPGIYIVNKKKLSIK